MTYRTAFVRTFAPSIAAIAFIAALLLAKWAGATELDGRGKKHPKVAIEAVTVCTRRPMLQGRVGETVLVCETVRGR